ncbi:12587_t:CDS:2 [Cetraspora pellucida]|uniref:12587_t:CDS:1 n=1 Tax=Cetraspora pellucida TaxID=1433469 RepID=A0A9N9H9V6_9GLOM|nr:12587_t:CDS:2 [Cetraspora pellucida]
MSDSNQYKILIAAEESEVSCKAIRHAFDLCSRLNTPYSLEIVYVIALNPETNVPFLHNLDKANNLDILLDAKKPISMVMERLEQYKSIYVRDLLKSNLLKNVEYNFNKLEGHGIVGKILKDYIETHKPDLNLLIVGSRDLDGLQKIVLSSTSDYLVKHLRCPVTIVKP